MSAPDLVIDLKKVDGKKRQAALDIILKEKGFARVSIDGEILVEPQKPMLDVRGFVLLIH